MGSQRVRSGLVKMRMRAGGLVLDATLNSFSRAAQFHPVARAAREGVKILRNVAYVDDGMAAHTMDIYLPRDRAAKAPAVLYVHGGGFRILSKDTHWMMALAFARRGFVVFNINYRLAPRYPFPAAILDVCQAALWLKQHAHRYGADIDKLVFAGESAGANLVTGLSVACCYERPEAWARAVFRSGLMPTVTVPACGILQVSDVERFGRKRKLPRWIYDRIIQTCHGYLPDQTGDPDGYLLADPLRAFEEGPPPVRKLPAFFIPCGTRDPLLEDSRRLGRALHSMGVPYQQPIYPGGVHAFHAVFFRENAKKCWREKFDFIGQHIEGIAAR